MSAKDFYENVESGKVLVDCHDRLLRISFIYLSWDVDGVLDIVDELHRRGWSFGQGDFKFNRYDFSEFRVELVRGFLSRKKKEKKEADLNQSKHSRCVLLGPNNGRHLPRL